MHRGYNLGLTRRVAFVITIETVLRRLMVEVAVIVLAFATTAALVGRFLPPALRVFLLTLAIVDDLLAITIIATFYTHDLTCSTWPPPWCHSPCSQWRSNAATAPGGCSSHWRPSPGDSSTLLASTPPWPVSSSASRSR